MAKPIAFDRKKIAGPPEGESWVWLTAKLLKSDAWRFRSISCIRLVDFLLLEHMAHAGTENGHLIATYDQLVKWGISRRLVHEAISEAERAGLIEVERGGRKYRATNHHSIFRLTFLPTKSTDEFDREVWRKPTNEWLRHRPPAKSKKQNPGVESGTELVPQEELS